MVEMVRNEYDGIPADYNYVVHHGDIIEAIMVNDKRCVLANIDRKGRNPIEQKKMAKEELYPIRSHIIAMLKGNHEDTLHTYGEIAQDIAEELSVPYATYSCKIIYIDSETGRLIFKQFATHGRKSISSCADDPGREQSNMRLILKRHLKKKAGDCFLMTKGHTHRILTSEPAKDLFLNDDLHSIGSDYTKANPDDQYIHPDLRWYLNVGSFYKIYNDDVTSDESNESYVEKFEYDPVQLGFSVTKVRDGNIAGVDEVFV